MVRGAVLLTDTEHWGEVECYPVSPLHHKSDRSWQGLRRVTEQKDEMLLATGNLGVHHVDLIRELLVHEAHMQLSTPQGLRRLPAHHDAKSVSLGRNACRGQGYTDT